MAFDSPPEKPCFETTKRLLAALINEGLAHATIKGEKEEPHRSIYLRSYDSSRQDQSIVVQTTPGALIEDRNGEVLPVIQPSMLCPPVIVTGKGTRSTMTDPGDIFTFISPWFEDMASQQILQEISHHLRNSGSNQG